MKNTIVIDPQEIKAAMTSHVTPEVRPAAKRKDGGRLAAAKKASEAIRSAVRGRTAKKVDIQPEAIVAAMIEDNEPELRPAEKPLVQPLAVSKKSMHFDFENRQYTPRVPFEVGVHKTFRPAAMFHPIWETSNFYDLFLPEGENYVEMSFFGQDSTLGDAIDEYKKIGKAGFFSKLLGEKYRVLIGGWDDHGSALLIPVASKVKTLADVGLTITYNSKKDVPKGEKYLRRLHAHYEWAVPGSCLGTYAAPTGIVAKMECAGTQFDVLHVDIDKHDPKNVALEDGIHLVDVGLLRTIGHAYGIPKLQHAEVGDAFKGTMAGPVNFGKGFFHVVEMDTYGIIIYGGKTQLTFDKMFFGSLGDVKGGAARTCIQSIGAFITEESKELWINQMTLFVSELMESLFDENKLKHMFLNAMGNTMDILASNEREALVLVEALRYGVPIMKNPGLFRRVVRWIMNRLLDCERGRIPYGNAAHRYNLMPDLTCFNLETGEVDWTKSVIPEHAVVCMDAEQGPFAMYRQPLGNAREAVITTNIHNRRFRKFIGRERVILGASALQHLAQMGGGDMDDAVIGTDNTTWIEVIGKAEYPVTPLPEAEAKAIDVDLDEDNEFLNGGTIKFGGKTITIKPLARQYPRTWSVNPDYFDAGTAAFNPQMSIGPVDNAVRLDLMLSGVHKENMLKSLADQIEAASGDAKAKLIKGYHWLEGREDFQLREVGSNLESFIDFVKMRKGDESVIAKLTSQINDLASQTMVFPECWAYLGRKVNGKARGRIPMDRKDKGDYVLAPSLVCDTLNTIKMKHAKLMEALKEKEWTMVQPPPQQLDLEYPANDGIIDEAKELRILWREWWMPFIAGETVTDPENAYKIILNGGVVTLREKGLDGLPLVYDVEGVNPKFNQWRNEPGDDPETDMRLWLAVEVARQTYRDTFIEAERGEDGLRRGFADGLLWSNSIGLMYIQALRYAGLTGLYLPVKFDRYSSNLRSGKIEVRVVAGVVLRKSDGFLIGHLIYDQEVENGDYVMEDGIVTIIEPAAELTASVREIDEEYANPVISEADIQA